MTTIERPQSHTKTTRAERFQINVAADEKIADKIRERHPDWPDIKTSFYFSSHEEESDMMDFGKHLDASDVFLYENVPADDEITIFFNEISNDPQQSVDEYLDDERLGVAMRGTSVEPIIRALYGSKKAVATIDIGRTPAENTLLEELDSADISAGTGETFEDALDDFNKRVAFYAEKQNNREDAMAANFENELEKIFNEFPQLKDKGDLKVLIGMGSDHTRMGHLFAEHGFDVDREFGRDKPYIYGYLDELVRTHNWGKQPSEELIKHAYAESVLHLVIGSLSRQNNVPTDEKIMYARHLTSELEEIDIKTIYQIANTGRLSMSSINHILARRGVHQIARTREDIEAINDKVYNRTKRVMAKTALGETQLSE